MTLKKEIKKIIKKELDDEITQQVKEQVQLKLNSDVSDMVSLEVYKEIEDIRKLASKKHQLPSGIRLMLKSVGLCTMDVVVEKDNEAVIRVIDDSARPGYGVYWKRGNGLKDRIAGNTFQRNTMSLDPGEYKLILVAIRKKEYQ